MYLHGLTATELDQAATPLQVVDVGVADVEVVVVDDVEDVDVVEVVFDAELEVVGADEEPVRAFLAATSYLSLAGSWSQS